MPLVIRCWISDMVTGNGSVCTLSWMHLFKKRSQGTMSGDFGVQFKSTFGQARPIHLSISWLLSSALKSKCNVEVYRTVIVLQTIPSPYPRKSINSSFSQQKNVLTLVVNDSKINFWRIQNVLNETLWTIWALYFYIKFVHFITQMECFEIQQRITNVIAIINQDCFLKFGKSLITDLTPILSQEVPISTIFN